MQTISDIKFGNVISYGYDGDGNLSSRTLANNTSSSYTYDGLDRVTNITHAFVGGSRTLDYGYDSVSNRAWTKRDGANGDVFGYDMADQSTSILMNVPNPDNTSPGAQTINYDANGNRTTFSAYGPTDTYTTNNLNQYSARNSSNAVYDNNGNTSTGLDGSTYTFDSQNRLLSASKGGSSESFKYDGLNRQVSRTVGAASPVYNIYDGWNLISEYAAGANAPTTAYLHGVGGPVKLMTSSSTYCYMQDASGCTSHVADSTGTLAEWYRYDLQGTPLVFNAAGVLQTGGSNLGIRHLFTGQQWYAELGLYDLRHRFYSPDQGRFIQPDPIGFRGDHGNIYRYCGNNPLNGADPMGLLGPEDDGVPVFADGGCTGVTVTGTDSYRDHSEELFGHGSATWGSEGWSTVGIGGLRGIASFERAGGGAPYSGRPGSVEHPFGDGGSIDLSHDGRVIIEGFLDPASEIFTGASLSFNTGYGSGYLQAFAMAQAREYTVPLSSGPTDPTDPKFAYPYVPLTAFRDMARDIGPFVNGVAWGGIIGGALPVAVWGGSEIFPPAVGAVLNHPATVSFTIRLLSSGAILEGVEHPEVLETISYEEMELIRRATQTPPYSFNANP